MKKILKKIISLVIVCSLLMGISVTALAADEHPDIDFGDPIRIIEYVDENGEKVTERIYFVPEPGSDTIEVSENGDISVHAEDSGKGWYKREKTIPKTEGTMYVTAYFTWGYGDVTVTGAYGGYYNIDFGIGYNLIREIRDIECTSGTGKGIINKYAYAEYSFVIVNFFTVAERNSVKITVNEKGDIS